jgi:hypothetical protein
VSIESTSSVLGLSMGRGNGLRKFILLGYANHADKHGRGAYPSTRTIADYAECDVRTVQRHIGWLLERGYLREGDQQMVDHLDPRHRPIVYDVAMSDEQVDQWASEGSPVGGSRARAAQAGRRGGQASPQVGRGDNLSPLAGHGSSQVSRGDTLSPLETGPRGDNNGGSGVTTHASRGDTGVTRTVLEPPQEPSSSSPTPPRTAAAATAAAGGGPLANSTAAALDVLPESVRDHPSVVPSAIARHIQPLERRGWPRAQIRERLAGIETADAPGAAALTRLADLAAIDAPAPRPERPPWCGHCDQRTHLREHDDGDGRPYRCPDCHPHSAVTNQQGTLTNASRQLSGPADT